MTTRGPQPQLANRLRGRANKIIGDHAEQVVAYHLHRMGFLAIVRLETGWKVQRAGGRIIGASPLAKVSGDFRCVVPGGRSVLVEVKRRRGALRVSDFQPHSRNALTAHAMAGGLSLVAWVSPAQGVAVFTWETMPAKGAISWETAEAAAFLVSTSVRQKADDLAAWNRAVAEHAKPTGTDPKPPT